MNRLTLILLVGMAAGLGGCGDDETTAEKKVVDDDPPDGACLAGETADGAGTCVPAGIPPDLPCSPGELELSDGSCQPAGLPEMSCPPGEAEVDGACQAAGISPGACAEGFAHDGDVSCTPILPADDCPAGLMAIPGDTACREVAPCGADPWGNIPMGPDTQYVDVAYAVGDSDGTSTKPWPTIQQAVDAAFPGAVVAIAAGQYLEDVSVTGKAVRIMGRCPAMVELVGQAAEGAVLLDGADAAEVAGLSVTGPNVGILVASLDVELRELHVHDTGRSGVELGAGSTGRVVASLFEGTARGVTILDAEASVEETAFRDLVNDPLWQLGSGVFARDSLVAIRRVLVDRAEGSGILTNDSTLELVGSVVRRVLSRGIGLNVVRGEASVSGSWFDANEGAGIHYTAAEGSIDTTVVKATASTGFFGYGLAFWDDGSAQGAGQPSNVSVERSVIEDNAGGGVDITASNASLDLTVVRDNHRDGGCGIYATAWATAQPEVELTHSMISSNELCGLMFLGSNATVTNTFVRDTLPGDNGQAGRGILAGQDLEWGSPSQLVITHSAIEDNADTGVAIFGADATIESSLVRGTRPSGDDSIGEGLYVAPWPEEVLNGNAPYVGSVELRGVSIEEVDGYGLLLSGGSVIMQGCAARGMRPPRGGVFGSGVVTISDGQTPAGLRLVSSLVEDNTHFGLVGFGSDIEVEATIVRDSQADDAFAIRSGTGVYLAAYQLQRGNATISHSLVERSATMGVEIVGSEATITSSQIGTVVPSAEGKFGDGLSVVASQAFSSRASATIVASRIESTARAGLATFGSDLHYERTAVSCGAFHLIGEEYDGQAFRVEDRGGNSCGCPEATAACVLESAGLAPPAALEAPGTVPIAPW